MRNRDDQWLFDGCNVNDNACRKKPDVVTGVLVRAVSQATNRVVFGGLTFL